jgi:capsule polysaccharide export protein KpsE/RkpR
MRGYLAESAPDFKHAMAELANLRAQLAKQDRDEAPASTGAQSGKDGKADYITNYRNFKYYETLYELFAKQYEIARVDESREGAVIQVLDAAQPPERKSKPKKALVAIIATLASGFALMLFVFVRQALRNGSQDEETARKLAAIRAGWKRAIGKA